MVLTGLGSGPVWELNQVQSVWMNKKRRKHENIV